ncbi:TolC family protein [Roseiconus lacunae]|uniref:TolC family protein n=1 Tax=Roseiconus lacunae TaxID=2605694 RepID=A0ABT7PQW9_9BACT|nr:TolC family protein [Roseiconus lacunae]MDM4018887.1 TolC family protein [Roseiconus lacunae]
MNQMLCLGSKMCQFGFKQLRREKSVGRAAAVRPLILLFATLPVAAVSLQGCARSTYRKAADREAYCLIDSRKSDARWDIPNRAVEPQRHSRMYLAAEQDCAPKPPDDFAAHRYMVQPDCKEIPYYQKIATRHSVENPAWIDRLPKNETGTIDLTQPLMIDLALLHSRDYQGEFEQVYLRALDLSVNRFEFDTQWFGGAGLAYEANGEDLGNDRLLTVSDRLGFGRNLAGGGQFATSVVNSLTWNFPGNTVQAGSATIVSTFTQPLLRGAFRHVRLESLTQSERNLLYQVRDFARFRRLFYVGLTERYLGLLTQTQSIRNTENNVSNLRQNLVEHEFYEQLETVSQVQVDQVFQQYQNGRRSLLSAEQDLIGQQDNLKFAIGLPAWVTFDIDESLLEPFELVDPRIEALQDEAQELFIELVQYLPPTQAPIDVLQQHFDRYQELHREALERLPDVEAELRQWQARLATTDRTRFSDDDRLDFEQQSELAERIETLLADLRSDFATRDSFDTRVLEKLRNYEANPPSEEDTTEQPTFEEILKGVESLADVSIDDLLPNDDDNTAIIAWKAVSEAIGSKLREEIAELYVAQTQIRLFLIDIEPFSIPSEKAISFALQNRLDLMNSKALVMDQFRKVEVAADALESDLNLSGQVAIGSDSDSNSPFKLDSANNLYQLGLQFDGPLNRRVERNDYRAEQVAYQAAIRTFIADKDSIANEVRQILRRLEFSRLSFQIARQQVFAATRQVDQAQIDLRQSRAIDANLTIILLQALDGMLDAKNSLVQNWIDYRVQKMRLFAALELLYLDENGQWINEETGLDQVLNFQAIDPEYFPPQIVLAEESNSIDTDLAPPASDPVLAEEAMGELELIEAEIGTPDDAPREDN